MFIYVGLLNRLWWRAKSYTVQASSQSAEKDKPHGENSTILLDVVQTPALKLHAQPDLDQTSHQFILISNGSTLFSLFV